MKTSLLKVFFVIVLSVCATTIVFGQGQQVECGTELSISVDDTSVSFPGTTVLDTAQLLTKAFSGANSVTINDVRCDNSGFTASVTATDYTNSTRAIPYSNLELKTTDYETLAGDSFGINALRFDSYATFPGEDTTSDPLDILIGDTQVRDPSQWALNPTIRLTVPGFQAAGTYTNTLSFTIL